MPLTGSSSTLSTTLRAALLANPATGAVDNAALTEFCNTIASVVVAHIVNNATVIPTGLPTPMSNAGGPVVGTGMIV